MTTYNIYILKCEHEKYFVGKTDLDVDEILKQHIKQKKYKCKWTKLHPPIYIMDIFIGDKWDEEATFYRMADSYGLNNVRGGSYKNVILTNKQKNFFNELVWNVNDICPICKKSGHSQSKCLLDLKDNILELEDVPECNGVYVLKLQNNKWSVNYSRTMKSSITRHFEGNGTKWTKLHVPCHIHKIYPGLNKYKLNDITLNYIEQFGTENVVGEYLKF